MPKFPLLALFLAAMPAAALSEESPAGRYTMEKTPDGFVRLDRQTGEMAYCRLTDGNLACRMAADERAAFEAELERLEKRVAALEKAGGPARAPLPDDAEVDRSISIMQRFMRAFMGLIEEFRSREGETAQRL